MTGVPTDAGFSNWIFKDGISRRILKGDSQGGFSRGILNDGFSKDGFSIAGGRPANHWPAGVGKGEPIL